MVVRSWVFLHAIMIEKDLAVLESGPPTHLSPNVNGPLFVLVPKGTGNFLATYIDLDEIAENTQALIFLNRAHPIYREHLDEISFDNSSTIVDLGSM